MDIISVHLASRGGQYVVNIDAWRGTRIEGTHNLLPIVFDRQQAIQGQGYPFYAQRATITAQYGEYLTLTLGQSTCVIACDRPGLRPSIVEGDLVPTLYLNGIPLEVILQEDFLSK